MVNTAGFVRVADAERKHEHEDAEETKRLVEAAGRKAVADPLSSYVSGATIAVTGGKPIL